MVPDDVRYLCAKIGGHWLGIEIDKIVEIATPGEKGLSKLGDNDDTLTYRGATIPAIYLPEVLTGDQIRYHTANRVLISETNNQTVGLVVDSVEEIVRMSKETIKPLEPGVTPLKNEMLAGYVDIDERRINIVSLENVMAISAIQ
jgi:purine-binding chemotaxis protein CheW